MGTVEPRCVELKTGEQAVVRSPDVADAEALIRLEKSARMDDELPGVGALVAGFQDRALEMIRARIGYLAEHPGDLGLIAVVDGAVVGELQFFARRERHKSHGGTLSMFVRPDWRRRGVGRALMHGLVAWASAHGQIERLDLNVAASNEAAIALYRSFGFLEEGRRLKANKLAPGVYVDDILMSRFVL